MIKNTFREFRRTNEPYAIFMSESSLRFREVRVLKAYQSPEGEASNRYSRWFIAEKQGSVEAEFNHCDCFIRDAVYGMRLVAAEREWLLAYEVSDELPNPVDHIKQTSTL